MGGYNIYNGRCKPAVKKGLLSYFLVGMSGALIGGILVLTLAPAVLLGRVIPYNTDPKNSISDDAAADDTKDQAKAVYMPEKSEEVPIIAAIAQKVMPAVVGIRSSESQGDTLSGEIKNDDSGSGVIVDNRGYILTSNHVANNSSSDISVYLSDGRSYPARVIWTDEGLDLSVLKINGENLAAAEIGDSNDVIIGELTVAIGNPSGMRFERSVTSGIISALNRTMSLGSQYLMEDLIETDTSIKDGNSGGPLINSEGRIIGINTVKVKNSEGMGYAIPINLAVPVIKSIIDTGTFRTPYLGLLLGLDRESADLYDHELNRGIYVESIDEDSPAYEAGLRKGDVILEINDIQVDTAISLRQIVFEAGAGNEIRIKYLDGQKDERIVTVKLDELRGN